MNYNLVSTDSNIVCKNGQSIIFNTYNGTTYTQLLKLNTSNITCSYPLISSTIYTDTINYNSSSSDLNIIFNSGYNFNIKNGATNYLQVNTTNTTVNNNLIVSNFSTTGYVLVNNSSKIITRLSITTTMLNQLLTNTFNPNIIIQKTNGDSTNQLSISPEI